MCLTVYSEEKRQKRPENSPGMLNYHILYLGDEFGTTKLALAISDDINCTCAFPALTPQAALCLHSYPHHFQLQVCECVYIKCIYHIDCATLRCSFFFFLAQLHVELNASIEVTSQNTFNQHVSMNYNSYFDVKMLTFSMYKHVSHMCRCYCVLAC